MAGTKSAPESVGYTGNGNHDSSFHMNWLTKNGFHRCGGTERFAHLTNNILSSHAVILSRPAANEFLDPRLR